MKKHLSCAQTRLLARFWRAPIYEIENADLTAHERRTAWSLVNAGLAIKERTYFRLTDAGTDAARSGTTTVEVA